MPTGYTANIASDTFTSFAARCLRGMGAFIHMRDDDFNVPLKLNNEPEPAYLVEQREITSKQLDELSSASDDYWKQTYENSKTEARAYHYETLNAQIMLAEKAKSIYLAVDTWIEPFGWNVYKQFMLEQLEITFKYDCYKLLSYDSVESMFDESVFEVTETGLLEFKQDTIDVLKRRLNSINEELINYANRKASNLTQIAEVITSLNAHGAKYGNEPIHVTGLYI